MTSDSQSSQSFYIGWDVGGWNCDNNGNSRDAIAILDSELALCGQPWRGNLRECINRSRSSREWIRCLFELCGVPSSDPVAAVMGIDTPLGFSDQFTRLVCDLRHVDPIETSGTNPYLFRFTERFLHERGFTPLSALKDMIGSQATKGRHVLAKFANTLSQCGVWSDGAQLTAIEAYPSACKYSNSLSELRRSGNYAELNHVDKEDALTCALIASMFKTNPHLLMAPPPHVPETEGWIWIPTDARAAP